MKKMEKEDNRKLAIRGIFIFLIAACGGPTITELTNIGLPEKPTIILGVIFFGILGAWVWLRK